MVYTIHIGLVVFSVVDAALSFCTIDGHLPSKPLVQGKTIDECLSELVFEVLQGQKALYIEQLYTTHDPIEKGSVMILYMVLLPEENLSNIHASMSPVQHIQRSFLEKDIVLYAHQRLRWKIEYTNIVYGLLPKQFTLRQMQDIYEVILSKRLDKRNFRKKILSLDLIVETGKKLKSRQARPAEVYIFKNRTPHIAEIL